MLEWNIVKHCAPTLAGIKTANMFSCIFEDVNTLEQEIAEANEKLNGKGVFIEILKASEKKALIYVYRRSMLEKDLLREASRALLQECDYMLPDSNDPIEAAGMIRLYLEQLKKRLYLYGQSCQAGCTHEAGAKNRNNCPMFCFPHEIGLFLGYPIADVRGFMEQGGKNYKCKGIWKVYGDEQETMKLFRKLEKCAVVYMKLFGEGRELLKMTVAV